MLYPVALNLYFDNNGSSQDMEETRLFRLRRHKVVGMKTVNKMFRISLVVIVATLIVAGQVQAAESCHKINAKGVGEEISGGHTVAKIKGGGLLQGTSEAFFAP